MNIFHHHSVRPSVRVFCPIRSCVSAYVSSRSSFNLRSIISLALRSLEVFFSLTPSLVHLIVRSLLRSRFCSFVCLIDRFQKLTFHLLCDFTRWSEKETRQRSLLSMNLTDQHRKMMRCRIAGWAGKHPFKQIFPLAFSLLIESWSYFVT